MSRVANGTKEDKTELEIDDDLLQSICIQFCPGTVCTRQSDEIVPGTEGQHVF